MPMTQASRLANLASKRVRVNRLRRITLPDPSSPCSWKTFFARSMPRYFTVVTRHGKLPPRCHEELPLFVAEESRNEAGTNRGKPIVE